MKWIVKDFEMYEKSKEYFDTAIIPLVPVSGTSLTQKNVAMGEFIQVICNELERQFHGRCILLPSFTYIQSQSQEKIVNDLKEWEKELEAGELKYIVFVTADPVWRGAERNFNHEVIWMPNISLHNLENEQKNSVILDQVEQLSSIILNIWSNH